MATLRELVQDRPGWTVVGDPDLRIAGIAYDSRMVKQGELFVALPGLHTNGSLFIADAVRRGAVAIATQTAGATIREGITHLVVPSTRVALADLSAAFFGHPGRSIKTVGITGTDGKTTTAYLVSAVLEAAGYKTGLITTVDVKIGERSRRNETLHTTPEPVEVQGLLREMVDERLDYAVLECSSHALALDRLRHCEFDAAVFTNLSPEHLNFHGSMVDYVAAKARLFEMLDESAPKGIEKLAVLNADDEHSPRLRAATREGAIWYGLASSRLPSRNLPLPTGEGGREGRPADRQHLPPEPSVLAEGVSLLPGGPAFTLVTPAGAIEVRSRLPGLFNVYNWLAAAAVGLSQGATLAQIRDAMASVESVPGRMQRIDRGQSFAVVVDFAHTPQALGTALDALRSATSGKLLVLFGLAGERDPGNRPEMGRLAARKADFAILTVDDPRFEDPTEIAEQIAVGARSEGWREGEHYLKVPDREDAIREAFRRAGPRDTVLLAGKGHERRQIIGDTLVPWSDAEVAARLLDEIRR